jgi:phosphatidylserine decarboxylase
VIFRRVAREGLPFIAGAWFIAAILAGFAPAPVAIAWLVVAVWVVAFFRDPVREGPRGDHLVIAPADGEVVSVTTLEEPHYLHGRALRISIFMNVFSVHVNRYPVSGPVEYRHYNRGAFGHAGTEKASLENEQSSLGVASPRGRVLVRQIAGLVARRIVTDHDVGATARQGERMGLIRFGSRVDLFLPATATVKVRTGETTRAGQTVVAQWS